MFDFSLGILCFILFDSLRNMHGLVFVFIIARTSFKEIKTHLILISYSTFTLLAGKLNSWDYEFGLFELSGFTS